MTESLKKLQQLKILSDVMESEKQTKLAKARLHERQIKDRLTQLSEDRQTQHDAANGFEEVASLEVWMAWSRRKVADEKAKQARQRAEIERCLTDLKAAFGRSSAIDGLLKREQAEIRQKRSRP